MKLERHFTTGSPEAVILQRAQAYLSAAGYRQRDDSPWRFHRSGAAPGVANPSNWNVETTIEVKAAGTGESVTITFDIDVSGTSLTRNEESFWNTEMNNLTDSIRTGNIRAPERAAVERTFTRRVFPFAMLNLIILLGGAAGVHLWFHSFSLDPLGFIPGIIFSWAYRRFWFHPPI